MVSSPVILPCDVYVHDAPLCMRSGIEKLAEVRSPKNPNDLQERKTKLLQRSFHLVSINDICNLDDGECIKFKGRGAKSTGRHTRKGKTAVQGAGRMAFNVFPPLSPPIFMEVGTW